MALNLPQFSAIDISQVHSQLVEKLTSSKAKIAELTQLATPTWENFALPMQVIDRDIDDFFSPISHLNGVKNNDELRNVYQACINDLTQYNSELGQNQALFTQLEKMTKSAEFAQLSAAQQRWLMMNLRDLHLAGVDLQEQEKVRFKEIKQRLAELAQTFSNHVLDATAAWSKNIQNEEALAGVPEAMRAMFVAKAKEKNLTGYVLGLDFPSYHAVISYAKNRQLREEIYLAYLTKASDQGPQAGQFDNSAVMLETLQLRQELAKLLGFTNYAERSLATKMADNVDEVCTFLLDLADKSLLVAEKELNTLCDYAKTLGIEQLQPWDVAFVNEKYRQQHYQFSQEILREYFPVNKVLAGLFTIVERLYGIEIRQQKQFDSYHTDVQFYEIYQDGQLIAGFYLDMFAREHKRGGAWMADCRARWLKADHSEELPVAFLTCNFRQAQDGLVALLSHDEVTTLFHEFGHGLHHMLTKVNVAGVSGISGVEWDAVELPSQFMENWCWQEEAIALMSEHYQTGEPLPQTLLANMLKARNFGAGMMMLRQIEFALFDFLLHSVAHIAHSDQIQELLEQVRDRVAVIRPPENCRFQHGFSHIFAGGYAAGYYSYKWAEVLSADAFSLFEEKGIFDQATGQKFMTEILQQGSARPAAESFAAFRGRAANGDALLKHSGLL